MSLSDDIEQLVDSGLLAERQAEAYILREIEAVPRQAAADSMEISVNTLDNALGKARSKIETAEDTLDVIDDLRHDELPSSCSACGSTLGGRWVGGDDGPLCLSCSDLDPEEVDG